LWLAESAAYPQERGAFFDAAQQFFQGEGGNLNGFGQVLWHATDSTLRTNHRRSREVSSSLPNSWLAVMARVNAGPKSDNSAG
jgi:hypothetical protein